jgi:aldose 1-epimerase
MDLPNSIDSSGERPVSAFSITDILISASERMRKFDIERAKQRVNWRRPRHRCRHSGRRALFVWLLWSALFALNAVLGAAGMAHAAPMKKTDFGRMADGTQIDLYVLTNHRGITVAITNFGATLVSVAVPDRKGQAADVILGYDSLDGYINDKSYFGATVGRYANRIARGQFSLNHILYTLAKNDGENHLHGGIRGFNKAVWQARDASANDQPVLELTYLSKDGEEGYPGNLSVKVVYTLTDQNELRIDYSATTDKETVINLTNHSYFNLAGQGAGSILNQQLTIHASHFTPVGAGLIPTGEIRSVQGTPFDFRHATVIGARIDQADPQLVLGHGYDHNWVVDRKNKDSKSLVPAAEAFDPSSGRVLKVWTTEPGIQLYTGNFLDGSSPGKGGHAYRRREAFCLETQHFPDSPNHPEFPSTVLRPGERYHSTTIYQFSVTRNVL